MKKDNYIFSYEQARIANVSQVGSKAYNTAYSNVHGLQVPEGVIFPIKAFVSYLNGVNLDALFLEIKESFSDAKTLIVRSSALGEDSEEASFAGQYLSLICLNKVAEIKDACEACWNSFSSQNVKAYKKAMKEPSVYNQNSMGLLIQRMINASSSGVCFTKDPLSEQKNVFVINAVHGMGESLVSGEVVADQYAFDIDAQIVVERSNGRQSFWRSPECPQKLIPLPLHLQHKQVLNSMQIEEIVQLARKSVKLFGSSQDIEWAYEGNRLFLLQARPITSVAQKREFELWTRDNVADVIPDAVTPLTWSLVKKATNNAFKNAIRDLGFPFETGELFKVFDGRVYFNQTAYQKMLNPDIKRNPIFLVKIGFKYIKLVFTLKNKVSSMTDEFWEGLNSFSSSASSAIIKLKRFLDKYMAIHIRIAVLMELGFLVIRALIKSYVPKDQENTIIDGLVTGLNEIESTASGEALWELASMIKDNGELTEVILSSPDKRVPDILRTWEGDYGDEWKEFLNKYGYASLKEFEIYYPRWAEDPSFIANTLKQYIKENGRIDLKTRKTGCSQKRMESERMLLKNIPFFYYLPLKFYIRHVRQCSIWRERIKQKLVRIMAEIRRQAIVFAEKSEIEPSENVFFLYLEEISQLKGGSIQAEFLKEIATRKKNWQMLKRKNPHKEIRVFDDGRQIRVPYLSGTGSKINGMPLSSGKATGPARVITDTTQMDGFKSGDILVAPSTNPSWTPLFTLAGAIVTDMGNYLSHGSIVARELGIPAVGNLFDATKRIKDGQIIFVDGDSGLVQLSQDEIP